MLELEYHEATYVFILVLRSIELAQCLGTLLKVRVRKSRVLFGDFIKILILLRIRTLLATLFSTEFIEHAHYAATNVFVSVLRSIEVAQYLALLLKVRVRKSRVLLVDVIKILILLRIGALLGHSFQERICLTRVLRGQLCIHISPVVH